MIYFETQLEEIMIRIFNEYERIRFEDDFIPINKNKCCLIIEVEEHLNNLEVVESG